MSGTTVISAEGAAPAVELPLVRPLSYRSVDAITLPSDINWPAMSTYEPSPSGVVSPETHDALANFGMDDRSTTMDELIAGEPLCVVTVILPADIATT